MDAFSHQDSYFRRGVWHRMVHSPTQCLHLHCANWKGPPLLPHLLYLCSLSNDRNCQTCTVFCLNRLGEFLSVENGKEEISEKEFIRSFQVAWLLVRRCFQQDLHCNAMASWCNCSIIAFQLNQFVISNKKGIILLTFTVVITHHFYKHGNCCCLYWRQSTIVLEAFFSQRQEGLHSCRRYHCGHHFFLSSSVLSSWIVIHVQHTLQKSDQKSRCSREW